MHKRTTSSVMGNTDTQKGVKLLLDKQVRSSVRLPVLEVVYTEFIKYITDDIRYCTGGNALVDFEFSKAIKFAEYAADIPPDSIFAIFGNPILGDSCGALVIHSNFAYSILEVLLGGGKQAPSLKVEGKLFTTIELEMMRYINDALLRSLSNAFKDVLPMQFSLKRIESNIKFAHISSNEDVVSVLRVYVNVASREGFIDLLLLYSSLEPVRKLLAQPFLIEQKKQSDPVWQKHFEGELYNTKVKVELRLNSAVSRMYDILNMKVGSTVILDKFANEDLDVTINGLKVTIGKLGKAGDRVAMQLTDNIDIAKFNNII